MCMLPFSQGSHLLEGPPSTRSVIAMGLFYQQSPHLETQTDNTQRIKKKKNQDDDPES